MIVTDCRCLLNVNAWKTQNSQIARWLSQLSEFDFSIEHRKGDKMSHVDALSRAPVSTFEEETVLSVFYRKERVVCKQVH